MQCETTLQVRYTKAGDEQFCIVATNWSTAWYGVDYTLKLYTTDRVRIAKC
ncbi:hypothetical protein RO3G_04663 [Rhizopus delemar RA 99-880]|uniref:Uncharacterized protein n=1 Tax=Rhizopus delemar (strain RA 99-880 / ATCC MYA-4621 / FGSC 9543 / NRRL 43880) TaxID=246409 RepID=I1BUS8_RHIO9|nr:hypothetical protein RO3G_04663 [Rhizopus delemar RA 99-880]|eukprot:EIE79958.1 hypothetical protein RO3G_04663 [Rhizopus delemar RA 99-880]